MKAAAASTLIVLRKLFHTLLLECMDLGSEIQKNYIVCIYILVYVYVKSLFSHACLFVYATLSAFLFYSCLSVLEKLHSSELASNISTTIYSRLCPHVAKHDQPCNFTSSLLSPLDRNVILQAYPCSIHPTEFVRLVACRAPETFSITMIAMITKI